MERMVKLAFILSVTALQAEAPELDENQAISKGSTVRPDDDTIKLISSPVLESIQPEGESTQRNETNVSPGAEMRTLDPRYMEVKVVYPEKQPSWWERVFNSLFK